MILEFRIQHSYFELSDYYFPNLFLPLFLSWGHALLAHSLDCSCSGEILAIGIDAIIMAQNSVN